MTLESEIEQLEARLIELDNLVPTKQNDILFIRCAKVLVETRLLDLDAEVKMTRNKQEVRIV